MRIIGNQYQILEAKDGKNVLEMVKEDKSIDLVLLDIVMSNMDGYQVLEKTKEQRYLEYLPVIIISSEGNTTSMENYADQAVVSKMTEELVIKQFRSEMPKEKNNESQNINTF